MAKKTSGENGVNVSEAIREYLKTHRSTGPKEAAEALSKQLGKEIPPAYVSNIKNLSRKKKPGRRVAGRRLVVSRKRELAATTSVADRLQALKGLVNDVGAAEVHKLVDVVA